MAKTMATQEQDNRRSAADNATKLQVTNADNSTALQIAEMEIESGEKVALTDGKGVGKKP